MKNTNHSQPYVRELQDRRAKNALAQCPYCGQSMNPKVLADHERTCPKRPKQADQIHNSGGGYRSDLEVVDPGAV